MSTTTVTGLELIDTELAKFSEGDLSRDEMALLVGRIDTLIRFAKDAKQRFESMLIEWIKANGEFSIPLSEGDQLKYWIGHDKTTKCRDVRAAFQFLMGIDLDEAMACLSSSAIKHGAFKKLLAALGKADEFDNYFEVVVKDTLEGGEPALKKLQSMDTRYLK